MFRMVARFSSKDMPLRFDMAILRRKRRRRRRRCVLWALCYAGGGWGGGDEGRQRLRKK